ncbi:asparagine synthase (glutamine-hydrolysing) [Halopenitus malekzadehii]|uniref:Asparagine synthase (Glutamine-hydrolysing) n=1 Tax=Halopenitus malekzadehii TaxID=1267564 RepID=A0A1H6I7I0_9EURY|nr:asparagine synthase-related protein [Halopenitus malekzadehii]SEH43579.1 asparagine synthase (glutamine-hydrolysing) [Halopenitus malekzadehii]
MTSDGDFRGVGGVTPDRVRRALRESDPFPGGAGFGGRIEREDGTPILARDVLGRVPVFVEADAADPTAAGSWAFDRRSLTDPRPVPAGAILTPEGERTVWTLPDSRADPAAAAQTAVETATRDVIRLDAGDDVDDVESDAAVAFSGGVDSAVIAAGAPEAPCYVAGFEDCHDVAAARAAADAMDRELHEVRIDHDDLRAAVPEIAAATGRTNPMDLAIAIPLYCTARAAAADGHDRILLGQGADELFGGYSKVVEPGDDHRVDANTVQGARDETMRTLPAQIERDVGAIRATGIEPVTPLLDDRVVAAARRLPGELLATPDERKIALRSAAEGLVPESVRTAEKKAVQYGTYVSRELDRLARQAGFKRRMENHVERYVEAELIESDPAGETVG